MAKNSTAESHLSQRGGSEEKSPINMHKRNKLGLGNGQSNPNGAERGPTDNKVANSSGKNY